MIKIYKNIGKGENLWKAITEPYNRGCYDPPVLLNWVESQTEQYMDKDWDYLIIYDLIWKLRDEFIFHLLKKLKIKSDNILRDERYDRDWLKGLLKKRLNKKEKDYIKKLIEMFETDLDNKRIEWASERANDDFSLFLGDIDKENDEELAQFLGIKLEIEGYEIDDEEYDISEVEFCKYCGEPMVIKCMKKIYDDHFEVGGGFKESNFYCSECGNFYKYSEKHCKLNNHIPEHEIMARLV